MTHQDRPICPTCGAPAASLTPIAYADSLVVGSFALECERGHQISNWRDPHGDPTPVGAATSALDPTSLITDHATRWEPDPDANVVDDLRAMTKNLYPRPEVFWEKS